jgi:hypothetical protein
MSEGEGRDEAREDEPEHDKDDSEDDHDVYLVSVRMFWRRVLRVNDGTHHLAWPTTGLALPPADQRVLRRTGGYLEWWSAELRTSQGERNAHGVLNAMGRCRNVRREQTLIKLSGVQPNSFRTGWRTQQLQLYTCWVPPATRPDVTSQTIRVAMVGRRIRRGRGDCKCAARSKEPGSVRCREGAGRGRPWGSMTRAAGKGAGVR